MNKDPHEHGSADPEAWGFGMDGEKERKRPLKAKVIVEHVDIIKDEFWTRRPWLFAAM